MDGIKLMLVLMLLSVLGLKQAAECGKIHAKGVSKKEAELIVKRHNGYRQLIANGTVPGQPRGINLKRMKYDARLAAKAQKVADTCTFAHKSITDHRFAVGQNLYMFMTTVDEGSSDWPSAIKSWFDEHNQYIYGECCSSKTGHYTQVIWHDTEFVGCGYTYFSDPSQSLPYRKLYVCNYGPAGNWVGEFPYQTGDSGCENLC